MTIFFYKFFDVALSLLKIFSSSCQPNSKYFQDKIQQELEHHRNKAILAYHLIVFVVYVFQAFVLKVSLYKVIMGIVQCIVILTLVVSSPNCNPNFQKVVYNIIVAIFGPIMMSLFEEGIHRVWLGTLMYPNFLLFCTGSVRGFLVQTGLQIVYMFTIYQPRMLKTIHFMSSEELLKSLTEAAIVYCFINAVTILCFFSTFKSACNRIITAEKKKAEIENQKTFVLSFSHELRNLMNSLIGNVRLAGSEKQTPKAQNYLRNADVCAELLLHLINNILDTGKVDVGELEVQPTPTNIFQTMEKVWHVCSELIRGKNLRGKLLVRRNVPPFLQFDPYRLTQIMLNLIGNAVKFTDTGSIDIDIEWKSNASEINNKSFEPYPFDDEDEFNENLFGKSRIFSTLDPDLFVLTLSRPYFDKNLLDQQQNYNFDMKRGILKITVSDTGHGMSKENISKLFQKFSQVSSDSSKRKVGTGLGLFITKELCEKMGGKIRVFSKQSKGSCFIICIPLDPILGLITQTSKDTDITDSQWPNPFRDLKVMIVDDDPFSQEILQGFFDRLQIQVADIAKNGLEAYKKYVEHVLKRDYPQVVTMDLTMPLMNGKEGAERIRKFEMENRISPCLMIMISGNCGNSEINECMNKNGKIKADAFVKKPAKIEEIAKVLMKLIDNNDIMREKIK